MSRTLINGAQVLDSSIQTNDIANLAVTDDKLSTTGVAAGTYAQVAVSDKGRVVSGSQTLPWSQISGTPAILPNLSKITAVPGMSGTSLIPFDNTTPLITEGTQIASATCTPSDPASKLGVQGSLQIDCANANRTFTIAVFRDSTCIGTISQNFITSGRPQVFSFFITDENAGAVLFGSSGVYSVRIGVNASATWYVNRMATAVHNGLQSNNDILIWEYI
jgi:phage-related tail fiber protein